jgi:hypothetical protein
VLEYLENIAMLIEVSLLHIQVLVFSFVLQGLKFLPAVSFFLFTTSLQYMLPPLRFSPFLSNSDFPRLNALP